MIEKSNPNTKKEYNAGLALLRAAMCFGVIALHALSEKEHTPAVEAFLYAGKFAVPVFMITSFMFARSLIIGLDKKKIMSRFERLIIPLVGWAVIYYAVYKLCAVKPEIGITDLIWQILTGHSSVLNPSMWFQFDLILLTALFLAVSAIFKKHRDAALWFLFFAALIFQYSGANSFFDGLRFELKYPLGRFFEMIPYAVLGYECADENVLLKLKENRLSTIIVSLGTIVAEIIGEVFCRYDGYGYGGVKYLAFGAALVALFYALPLEKLPEKAIGAVKLVTGYTLGIYCMHRLAMATLNKIAPSLSAVMLRDHQMIYCVIIYIICYAVSLGFDLLFRKLKLTRLRSMFI